MQTHHHQPIPAEAPPELTGRIARSLGIGEMTLNEMDFDDIFVSENVVKTLSQLAVTVLGLAEDKRAGARIRAFWRQDSPELLLCAEVEEKLHLLRVPESQWAVKPRTVH